jgi:hypothetical protein
MSCRPLIAAFLAGCVLLAMPARATAAGDDDDKAAAQQQFQAGQKAFAAGDFRAAAEAFEEAYRRKPHHAPLWNAARAWYRAGESVRAANLYAKYLREAPPGTKDRDSAQQALKELSGKLGKISVQSTGPTDLAVDDAPVDANGVYVAPGEHAVSGKSGKDPVKKSVTVEAGQSLSVTLDPPPPPPVQPRIVIAPAPPPKGFHLPWIAVAVGGALSLGAGGVTVWSGLDSKSKRDDFTTHFNDKTATQDQLDKGKATEVRTNILLGVTAGLVVLTGVAALFVDWGGNSKSGYVGPGVYRF